MVGYVFFKWYFEKKWVGRAMGNETIYWDGLGDFLRRPQRILSPAKFASEIRSYLTC